MDPNPSIITYNHVIRHIISLQPKPAKIVNFQREQNLILVTGNIWIENGILGLGKIKQIPEVQNQTPKISLQ